MTLGQQRGAGFLYRSCCSLNRFIVNLNNYVGGMTQWLVRRSLTGELSLIFAWSIVDIYDHFVVKVYAMGQPTTPTQHSIPSGVGKWVVTHTIRWITGVETIKRQTSMAVWPQVSPVAEGLAYGL